MNVEIRPEPSDDERAAILKALDTEAQAPPLSPPEEDDGP
jgi:hypothetical protein